MGIYNPTRKTANGQEDVQLPISAIHGLQASLDKLPRIDIHLGDLTYESTLLDLYNYLSSKGITASDYVILSFGGWQEDVPTSLIKISEPFAGNSLIIVKLWLFIDRLLGITGGTTYPVSTTIGEIVTSLESGLVGDYYSLMDAISGVVNNIDDSVFGEWLFNDEIIAPKEDITFTVNFESYDPYNFNGGQYNSLSVSKTDLVYGRPGPSTTAYYLETKTWSYDECKRVVIKPGPSSAEFAEWLKANATKQNIIGKIEAAKQDKVDNSLETESKTIVGAINEINAKVESDNKENILGTWELNETLTELEPNVSFYVNFTSTINGEKREFVAIRRDKPSYYDYLSYLTYQSANINAYNYSNNTWNKNSARTITITGGDDINNEIFVTWLKANAIKQESVVGTWVFNATITSAIDNIDTQEKYDDLYEYEYKYPIAGRVNGFNTGKFCVAKINGTFDGQTYDNYILVEDENGAIGYSSLGGWNTPARTITITEEPSAKVAAWIVANAKRKATESVVGWRRFKKEVPSVLDIVDTQEKFDAWQRGGYYHSLNTKYYYSGIPYESNLFYCILANGTFTASWGDEITYENYVEMSGSLYYDSDYGWESGRTIYVEEEPDEDVALWLLENTEKTESAIGDWKFNDVLNSYITRIDNEDDYYYWQEHGFYQAIDAFQQGENNPIDCTTIECVLVNGVYDGYEYINHIYMGDYTGALLYDNGWITSRNITVRTEPSSFLADWLYEVAVKEPQEYQPQIDYALKTDNKNIVSAINEVNSKVVAKTPLDPNDIVGTWVFNETLNMFAWGYGHSTLGDIFFKCNGAGYKRITISQENVNAGIITYVGEDGEIIANHGGWSDQNYRQITIYSITNNNTENIYAFKKFLEYNAKKVETVIGAWRFHEKITSAITHINYDDEYQQWNDGQGFPYKVNAFLPTKRPKKEPLSNIISYIQCVYINGEFLNADGETNYYYDYYDVYGGGITYGEFSYESEAGWHQEDGVVSNEIIFCEEPSFEVSKWVRENADKIDNLPQIRFARMETSDDSYTFAVEILGGGEIIAGDELQLCGMSLSGRTELGKRKLRAYKKHKLSKADINARFIVMKVNSTECHRLLYRNNRRKKDSLSTMYFRLKRPTSYDGRANENNAIFSNTVMVLKTYFWDSIAKVGRKLRIK
jgi:hypothetical protein